MRRDDVTDEIHVAGGFSVDDCLTFPSDGVLCTDVTIFWHYHLLKSGMIWACCIHDTSVKLPALLRVGVVYDFNSGVATLIALGFNVCHRMTPLLTPPLAISDLSP